MKLAGVGLAVSLLPFSHGGGPKHYYLALGDSIAYGIQPAKVEAGLPPSGFRTGYVDVFAARLRKLAPGLEVVNYGCPGETTRTFVSGGCPWLALQQRLHDPFEGGQQGAALAFLRAHRRQVSPITLTLGANDLNEAADACHGNFACIKRRAPTAIAQFEARFGRILAQLRAAAPAAVIVVTGLWNFNADDLARTDPFFLAINAAIARETRRVHARYADVFRVFNPQGDPERERARVCAFSFICKRGDSHPTDAGYRAIAAVVWRASGY
jgi:lysophospholipase L1-like esterase